MKGLICLLLCVVALAAASSPKPYYDLKDAEILFEKFVKHYGKHYKDAADRKLHFENFKNNLKDFYYNGEVFEINDFADYTQIRKRVGLKKA